MVVMGVRGVLGACLLAFLAYCGISLWAARRWKLAAGVPDADWTPYVTLLKPVAGVDAEAYDNFASFCRLDYPPDRIQYLFGALDASDPALALVKDLHWEFPHLDIQTVVTGDPPVEATNLKVCNLIGMLPHARHDLLVLCDSDMRARPDYLRRVVAPFRPGEKRVGMVTCPYRGARALNFAAVLEALGIGSDFIPGVLVSRALEGVGFALGSTIALPKSVLEEIGGFEPLIDELADDFRLGEATRKAGYEVVLSDYVIDDVLGREAFGSMWSRRLRWARTVRACRPAGYAGAFITHGLGLGLLFLVASGFALYGWVALLSVLIVRIATAMLIAATCTGDAAVMRYALALPLSDLISFALYIVSYCGNGITWRGKRFRLLPGGKLQRIA